MKSLAANARHTLGLAALMLFTTVVAKAPVFNLSELVPQCPRYIFFWGIWLSKNGDNDDGATEDLLHITTVYYHPQKNPQRNLLLRRSAAHRPDGEDLSRLEDVRRHEAARQPGVDAGELPHVAPGARATDAGRHPGLRGGAL